MILRFLQKGTRFGLRNKNPFYGSVSLRKFSSEEKKKPKEKKKKLTKIDHFIALGRYKRQTGTLLLLSPCIWGVMMNAPLPLSNYDRKQ